jgi:hypothetical protein
MLIFVAIAVPCIGVIALALLQWQPMVPIGKGIGELSVDDQVAYLVVLDQLESNEMLEDMRRGGGTISISDYSGECGPVESKPLADAMQRIVVGKITVRTTCDPSSRMYLYLAGNTWNLSAGVSCGGLCSRSTLYNVLGLGPIPLVIRGPSFLH